MCNYRRLTRNRYLAHIPENVIPGDFSQKKTQKTKITEYEDFMECEDLAERVDFIVCARP